MRRDWQLPEWLDSLVTFLVVAGAAAICVVGLHGFIAVARAHGL